MKDGKKIWSFRSGKDLSYRWAFDYYYSSPTVYKDKIAFGSGDGNLYLLNARSGKLIWKFTAGSIIRSSPAISDEQVFVGDFAGYFYSINLNNGKLNWKFETNGVAINNLSELGFDRKAIISSPSISNHKVFFGGRDGFFYALNTRDGSLLWKTDNKVSWMLSTPAIHDGCVITGTSDGHFVQSLDIVTGKERWKFKTNSPVWASPAVSHGMVYFGDYDGLLHGVDESTGTELWDYKINAKIMSSPILYHANLCFTGDDGVIYVLKGSNTSVKNDKIHKAVYWEKSVGYSWFSNGVDEQIKDFFQTFGYEILNRDSLEGFIRERLADKEKSVVIFAKNLIPQNVVPDSSDKNLFMKYLYAGGKIILLGPNPLAYFVEPKTEQLTAIDYTVASKITGINYDGESTDAIRGWYASFITPEGRKLGLNKFYVGLDGVPPGEVTTVLAQNEKGDASSWVKNYSGLKGTGLIQLWVPKDVPADYSFIKSVAEMGF